MTPGKQAALSCLECGQAIPDGRRWLCIPRCTAVMALVRYGRKHMAGEDPDEVGLDDALLRRYAGDATIVGRFPTQSIMEKVRVRDRHRCQYVGCDAHGADEVDYSTQLRGQEVADSRRFVVEADPGPHVPARADPRTETDLR